MVPSPEIRASLGDVFRPTNQARDLVLSSTFRTALDKYIAFSPAL